MAMSCYNKLFISEIKRTSGEHFRTVINKSIMKTSVLGVVTGIQKFSRKTIYSVDDGTDALDCILWHNEPGFLKKISKLRRELDSGNAVINKDLNDTCQLFLSKVEVKEDDIEYNHGDTICCLGVIKLIKGKLLLDIYHHSSKAIKSIAAILDYSDLFSLYQELWWSPIRTRNSLKVTLSDWTKYPKAGVCSFLWS